MNQASTHLVDIYEENVKKVKLTTLNAMQWCVILDPYDQKSRSNKLGSKEIRRGELSFFLQPGERLEQQI